MYLSCRFQKIIIIFLLLGQLVLARESNASIGGDGIRICGRRLIATLGKVCLHKYSGPIKEYGGYLRRVKRAAIGLATDCCSNRCSIQHIQENICAQ